MTRVVVNTHYLAEPVEALHSRAPGPGPGRAVHSRGKPRRCSGDGRRDRERRCRWLGERAVRERQQPTPFWLRRRASRRSARLSGHFDAARMDALLLAPCRARRAGGLPGPGRLRRWTPERRARISGERRGRTCSAGPARCCPPRLFAGPRRAWRTFSLRALYRAAGRAPMGS